MSPNKANSKKYEPSWKYILRFYYLEEKQTEIILPFIPSTDSEDCGHQEDIVRDGESYEQTVECFPELSSDQNSDRQCIP